MTSADDMLVDMEQEEEKLAGQRGSGRTPADRQSQARGVYPEPLPRDDAGGNVQAMKENVLTRDPTRPPLVEPGKDLRDVPTTLEGVLAVESEGKNANEVLGVLVAAHERRAMAILQRTRVQKEDVLKIAKGFQLAKHGIGGRNPALNQPIPDVSEWILTIVETLPSVGGQSREEFVNAWGKSQEERRLQRLEEEKRRSQYMGT